MKRVEEFALKRNKIEIGDEKKTETKYKVKGAKHMLKIKVGNPLPMLSMGASLVWQAGYPPREGILTLKSY